MFCASVPLIWALGQEFCACCATWCHAHFTTSKFLLTFLGNLVTAPHLICLPISIRRTMLRGQKCLDKQHPGSICNANVNRTQQHADHFHIQDLVSSNLQLPSLIIFFFLRNAPVLHEFQNSIHSCNVAHKSLQERESSMPSLKYNSVSNAGFRKRLTWTLTFFSFFFFNCLNFFFYFFWSVVWFEFANTFTTYKKLNIRLLFFFLLFF